MRRGSCGWYAICVAAVVGAGIAGGTHRALGATLSSQSSVGIQAEYASNPFMLASGGQSAEWIALLANVPLTYTSNTQTVDFTPRLRYGETHGPVALLSNYQYLDADWHWNSERNSFVTTAQWHHDSTLYNEFENASLLGHDLTRLEQDASVAWQRALSERSDLQLSGSWDRVAYSHNSASSLNDYRYAQSALEYDWNLTERWRWSTAAGYGQYALLNGSYRSDDRFAQTTLNAQWSELWVPAAARRHTESGGVRSASDPLQDPDAGLVAQAQGGKLEARRIGSPPYPVDLSHSDSNPGQPGRGAGRNAGCSLSRVQAHRRIPGSLEVLDLAGEYRQECGASTFATPERR